jgi:hypothetical protein
MVFASASFLLEEWLILLSLAAIVGIVVLIVQGVRRKRSGKPYSVTERKIWGAILSSLILILISAGFFLRPLINFYYVRYFAAARVPNPTVTFSAYPTTITLGQTTTIMWTSTNADKCVVVDNNTNLGISDSATSGQKTLTPTAPGQADYFMTCYGPDLGDPLTQKFQDAYVLVDVSQPLVTSINNTTTCPDICIISPQNGTTIKPGSTLMVTVTSSPMVSIRAMTVQAQFGASNILVKPPYNFSLPIPANVQPGIYSINAIAESSDTQESAIYSKPIQINIGNP